MLCSHSLVSHMLHMSRYIHTLTLTTACTTQTHAHIHMHKSACVCLCVPNAFYMPTHSTMNNLLCVPFDNPMPIQGQEGSIPADSIAVTLVNKRTPSFICTNMHNRVLSSHTCTGVDHALLLWGDHLGQSKTMQCKVSLLPCIYICAYTCVCVCVHVCACVFACVCACVCVCVCDGRVVRVSVWIY